MSFLDDFRDFFITGDTFYSDNKNRENRIRGLAEDCNNFMAAYKNEILKSKELMGQLNDKIDGVAQVNESIPEQLKFQYLEEAPYEKMLGIYCQLSLNPLIQITWKVAYALQHNQSLDEIAEDLMISVEIVAAMYAGTFVTGMFPGLLVIPGLIQGNARRKKLQETIKQGVSSRRKVYQLYYVTRALNQHLQTVILLVDAMEKSGVSLKDLEKIIQDKIKEFACTLQNESKVESDVDEYLRQRDKNMQQWTNEG